jgi:UDP-GlcNAc:undecaprenyl-phosphate GlcNAc-1-phosphate transferase
MFITISLVGFLTTLVFTGVVRRYAEKAGIVDLPKPGSRKIHTKPTPLLGGFAVFFGFACALLLALYSGMLPEGVIETKHILGLLLGAFWLLIGGYFDDKFDLPPRKQIIWPILAVITVIAAGIGIESLSRPWGGQWFLDQVDIPILKIGGIPYHITLLADIFTFLWLLGVIYATKFFDGLDGLVSGVTFIGAIVVFLASLLPRINQPETALLALIVASCFAGFLIWNFHPAKIFLGESGSTLAGFLMGSLAIIAESKVMITLIVMALPILDLVWAIVRRILVEKKSLASADKKHIHHRLLQVGFSHRNAVLLLYAWAIILGIAAWVYQMTNDSIYLLLALAAIIVFAGYLVHKARTYV